MLDEPTNGHHFNGSRRKSPSLAAVELFETLDVLMDDADTLVEEQNKRIAKIENELREIVESQKLIYCRIAEASGTLIRFASTFGIEEQSLPSLKKLRNEKSG